MVSQRGRLRKSQRERRKCVPDPAPVTMADAPWRFNPGMSGSQSWVLRSVDVIKDRCLLLSRKTRKSRAVVVYPAVRVIAAGIMSKRISVQTPR
jgi:hypothetical protein